MKTVTSYLMLEFWIGSLSSCAEMYLRFLLQYSSRSGEGMKTNTSVFLGTEKNDSSADYFFGARLEDTTPISPLRHGWTIN